MAYDRRPRGRHRIPRRPACQPAGHVVLPVCRQLPAAGGDGPAGGGADEEKQGELWVDLCDRESLGE